jgi:CRISPR-associated endonuclease/helicase Cas3
VSGAGVFIDESHASLPARLWPRAWDWLSQLARDWRCHLVLGSGSLNRLWSLPEFVSDPADLPHLVRDEVRSRAAGAEQQRIAYQTRPEPLELEQLIAWLPELPGPRLLIVNTVQTAAAIARELAKSGRQRVEHLSTALTPKDREATLARIKERLASGAKDADWTLVATSCVEAGVDVSFRTGLRERASLTSLIQVGGRVNRSGEYGSADVWDFQLQTVGLVLENPGYRESARVLAGLIQEGRVAPEFCTDALQREIRLHLRIELYKELREAEATRNFPKVEQLFRVIDQATVTVVIDKGLIKQLDAGASINWQDLQRLSVQIYSSKKLVYGVHEFAHLPGLHRWTLPYDSFLGYMAGVLPLADAQLSAFIG